MTAALFNDRTCIP